MARQEVTLVASGVVGNSQGANTAIATITNPGPGRYRVWGNARHSLVDGVKITGPAAPIILAGGAGDTVVFGPFVFDVLNSTTSIAAVLNTATGASDTAGATLYAEKINH